jgi:hypothetical protein
MYRTMIDTPRLVGLIALTLINPVTAAGNHQLDHVGKGLIHKRASFCDTHHISTMNVSSCDCRGRETGCGPLSCPVEACGLHESNPSAAALPRDLEYRHARPTLWRMRPLGESGLRMCSVSEARNSFRSSSMSRCSLKAVVILVLKRALVMGLRLKSYKVNLNTDQIARGVS